MSLAFTALLPGCAYEGTIVRKEFRPLPFPDSLGIEGIYKFELRDRAGQMHSQIVTAWVFANYRSGDYFNDLQAAPADRVVTRPMRRPLRPSRPLENSETPYRRPAMRNTETVAPPPPR